MQIVRGSDIPFLLQLIKTDSTFFTTATVKYKVYNDDGVSVEVSSQETTYDPIFCGYYDKLDVSADWTDQVEGNYLIVWTLENVSGFPTIMIENLCVLPGGIIESTYTQTDVLRIILAVLAGKSTGGGTSNLAFRDIADSKDRLSEQVDRKGNRTEIFTLDGS